MAIADDTHSMALFCDFENVALGVRDAKYDKFDIAKVLERLLVKGSIVVKKAYCDWERYKEFKARDARGGLRADRDPARAHVGQELGRHPHGGGRAGPVLHQVARRYLRHHQRRFGFLATGVQAAREQQSGDRRGRQEVLLRSAHLQLRRVHLLRRPRAGGEGEGEGQGQARAAQEGRPQGGSAAKAAQPEVERRKPEHEDKTAQALDLVVGTFDALVAERGEDEKIWGSMIKQTLKRRHPGFNESYYGFKSFNSLLEEAAIRGLLDLKRDEKSGGYIVSDGEHEPLLAD